MGLESVELTMEIEDTFKVPFAVDDLEKIAREGDVVVGDLYDLILRKLDWHDTSRFDVHLNFALWSEVQQDMHVATRLPLSQIELKTPLATLFPRSERRTRWQDFSAASPYRIPELDYPPFVRLVGFTLAGTMVYAELFHVWQLAGVPWLWQVLGFVGLWLVVETYTKLLHILRRWRTTFPSGVRTVKDLCRSVFAANYDRICDDAGKPLDEKCRAVWSRLTEVVGETFDVDSATVTFQSRLGRDFGM